MLNLLDGPTLTSIHDYGKNHSFDYTDLFFFFLLMLKLDENITIKRKLGTSLVVQWVGVCLPMNWGGQRFDPWSRVIPCALEQLCPLATTTEL